MYSIERLERHLEENRQICPVLYLYPLDVQNNPLRDCILDSYIQLGKDYLNLPENEKEERIKKIVLDNVKKQYQLYGILYVQYYLLSERPDDTPEERKVYNTEGHLIEYLPVEKKKFPYGNLQHEKQLSEQRVEYYQQTQQVKSSLMYRLKNEVIPALYVYTDRSCRNPSFISRIRNERYKNIKLGKYFLSLSRQDKDDMIKTEIIKHIELFDGKIPSFGRITHFVLSEELFDEVEDRRIYDLDGNIIRDLPTNQKLFWVSYRRFHI